MTRILTFNHHEPFLVAMAGLDATFDVVTRAGALDLGWNVRARAVPRNFRLIDLDQGRRDLRAGCYDVVVSHTVRNLGWMFPYRGARHVFVAHIPLFRQTLAQRLRSAVKSSAVSAFAAGRDFRFVAVSEWKRASWGRQGVVVPFFPVPFAASLVSSARAPDVPVAVVANRIVERGEELGLGLVEEIRKRVPLRIIGANPDLAGAHVPSDFAEFVRLFSECAVYLYTIEHPHGDGYNTSMLEAMSLGMPVVTVPNPTSPIVHGVNGLVGRGADELVAHIETLRADRLLRERIGAAAKATVEARFTRERFLSAWREALFDHG